MGEGVLHRRTVSLPEVLENRIRDVQATMLRHLKRDVTFNEALVMTAALGCATYLVDPKTAKDGDAYLDSLFDQARQLNPMTTVATVKAILEDQVRGTTLG